MKTFSNGKPANGSPKRDEAAISKYFVRKALLMRIAGRLMLVLASPVILLLVLVVRLSSAGPGLYRQPRTGRHGKEFTMYKIRTMYNDAESVCGPVWCVPGDSRITPVGRVLRLLHLDELPQLINVARGEMDLVGPRPERPVFVAKLAREIPNYHARLRILPGVTGLAQVNLPPDETLDCVRRKLLLDCAYIREAGPGLDLRILLCTLLRMIGIRHGRAVRWLRLERPVHLLPDVSQLTENELMHWNLNGNCQPLAAAQAHSIEHANGRAVAAAVASENGSATTSATLPHRDGAEVLRMPKPR